VIYHDSGSLENLQMAWERAKQGANQLVWVRQKNRPCISHSRTHKTAISLVSIPPVRSAISLTDLASITATHYPKPRRRILQAWVRA
jgi:hypothetical protein